MSKLTNEKLKDKGGALERKHPSSCFKIEESGGGQMHNKRTDEGDFLDTDTSEIPGCLLLSAACLTWNSQGLCWTSPLSTIPLTRRQATAVAKMWHPGACHPVIPEVGQNFLKGPCLHLVKDVFSMEQIPRLLFSSRVVSVDILYCFNMFLNVSKTENLHNLLDHFP